MIKTVVKLGAFVAVCTLFTGYLAFTIGNIHLFQHEYKLAATFDDVTGLLPNDNVKVAGVPVGKVTGIKIVQGRARVSFTVRDDVKVPTDSKAAVRWRNLLGQRYVYLYPGEASTTLQDGGRVAKTVPVVDLGELFNRLGPIVKAIDPAKVNEFLDTIVAALDGNEGKIRQSITDLAVLTKGLASRDEAIGRLIVNLNTVTGAINSPDAQIRTMLDNLVAIAGTFSENTDVLDGAVTNLGDFSANLGGLLANNRSQVDGIVTSLTTLINLVQSKLPQVDHALASLDEGTKRLFTSSHNGEWLNQTIPCGIVGYEPRVPVDVCIKGSESLPTSATSGAAAITQLLGAGGGLMALKSFRDRNPYAIGLVSVAVIGAFVGMAFMVGVLHLLEHTYQVKAVFADAAGIRGGDEVRVAGVKAGRVTKIKADHDNGNVIVLLEVDKGVHLGPRTNAEIALATLLGTKFVRLSGPVVTPYIEDRPKAQRVIPVERTKTPFDVFDLATTSTRRIQQTDTEKLNKFITELADVTSGNPADIKTLIDSVAKVSTAINERDQQLGQLIERADRLSGLLDDKDQTLVQLIDQSRGVLELVQRRRDDIARGLQGGDQLATELSRVLRVHEAQLDQILTTLHPTLDIVDKQAKHIDAGLSFLGPGSLGLSKAAFHGPWADVYVRAVGPDLLKVINDELTSAVQP